MLEIQGLYNSILVRGRRSAPTYDQVAKEARLSQRVNAEVNLYRL